MQYLTLNRLNDCDDWYNQNMNGHTYAKGKTEQDNDDTRDKEVNQAT